MKNKKVIGIVGIILVILIIGAVVLGQIILRKKRRKQKNPIWKRFI